MLRRLIGENIELEIDLDPAPGWVTRDLGPARAGDPEPGGQRPRRHARGRPAARRASTRSSTEGDRRLRPAARALVRLRSPTPGTGMTEEVRRTSSSPSSPPRSAARAPASASPPSTASSSRAAADRGGERARQRHRLPRLPAAGRRARRGRRRGPSRRGRIARLETILLVEDEDNIREPARRDPARTAATRCCRPPDGARRIGRRREGTGRSTC